MKPTVFNYQEYERVVEENKKLNAEVANLLIRCRIAEADRPMSDVVLCTDCRYCEEQGGHANCDGYLYCTWHKTLVDEGRYCSWGERREP